MVKIWQLPGDARITQEEFAVLSEQASALLLEHITLDQAKWVWDFLSYKASLFRRRDGVPSIAGEHFTMGAVGFSLAITRPLPEGVNHFADAFGETRESP